MSLPKRLNYYRRIFSAYLTPQRSHLTFWHETPEVNSRATLMELGEYYMTFTLKADYPGEYDDAGIPLLNYHGSVGLQYNPIAIAQYGLGNYNLYTISGSSERRAKFLSAATWLVNNLEMNPARLHVWNHHFEWEYRSPLKAPWYSGLAQGQGISLLVRAYKETSLPKYLDAAEKALVTMQRDTREGGVASRDEKGYLWLEEVIVEPPTHILNGFIWASWGLYDYYLLTNKLSVLLLFRDAMRTLKDNLHSYDLGFWSLYEQSGTRMKMLASPFYHALHIVQLKVLFNLTGEDTFIEYAQRWNRYTKHWMMRTRAITYKAIFKLLYY